MNFVPATLESLVFLSEKCVEISNQHHFVKIDKHQLRPAIQCGDIFCGYLDEFSQKISSFVWITETKKHLYGKNYPDYVESVLFVQMMWKDLTVDSLMDGWMVDFFVHEAKKRKIKQIWSNLFFENKKLHQVYEKIGFFPKVMIYQQSKREMNVISVEQHLNLSIRSAVEQDFDFLWNGNLSITFEEEGSIEFDCKQSEENNKEFFRQGILKGEFRVICKSNVPVAFVQIVTDSGNCPVGCSYMDFPCLWVSNIYVHESQRGTGVGRFIYQFLAEKYSEHECWLDVLTSNVKSHLFHTKMGFKPQSCLYVLKLEGEMIRFNREYAKVNILALCSN